MRNLFLAGLLLSLFTSVMADVTFSTVKLDRWSKQKGTFILWYGYDNKVTQYAAFTVEFDDSYTEEDVVNDLKKKVYTSNKYMTYDFKGNMECYDVYNYIARNMGISLSDVKDLRFGNCTNSNYQYLKPEVKAPTYNQQVYDQMKPYINDREKALLADGWVKIYEDYQNENTAAEITFTPGKSYTGLGAVYANGDTNIIGRIIILDSKDTYAGGTNYEIDNRVLLEVNDFQPLSDLKKAFFLVDANDNKAPKSCLVIYEKPIDFKRDFYRLIESRKNGFKDIKAGMGNLNTEDYRIYYSSIRMGYHTASINETSEVIEYILKMDLTDPAALRFLTNLIPVLQELPAKGYESEEYKNSAGGDVTKVTKDGEEIMLIVSYPDKDMLYFYVYKLKNK